MGEGSPTVAETRPSSGAANGAMRGEFRRSQRLSYAARCCGRGRPHSGSHLLLITTRTSGGHIHALPPDVTALERSGVVLDQPQRVYTKSHSCRGFCGWSSTQPRRVVVAADAGILGAPASVLAVLNLFSQWPPVTRRQGCRRSQVTAASSCLPLAHEH